MKNRTTISLIPHHIARTASHRFFTWQSASGTLSLWHIAAVECGVAILIINIWRLTRSHILVPITLFLLMQGGVWYLVKANRKKTTDRMEQDLPQALDIMSRVYRIHPNLKVAVQEVPRHMPPGPLANLFQEVHTLATFGYSVEEAIVRVNAKAKSEDLAQVATAIRIHLPQGGDIAAQLQEMASLLRRRREVSREVSASMFQNKVSSIFTSAFVPIIILLVFTINTEGYREILKNPTGRAVFLAALGWWACGIIIMKRLMKVAV